MAWRSEGAPLVAVRANFSVTLGRGRRVRWAGRCRAGAQHSGLATDRVERRGHRLVASQFLALRCWRSMARAPATSAGYWATPRAWAARDWKYFWSDFPANTPLAVLVEYAHRRHWVEQFMRKPKRNWLGSYQGRRWMAFIAMRSR